MAAGVRFEIPLKDNEPVIPSSAEGDQPVCLIVLGMAGSGKTTFVQCLTSSLHSQDLNPYVINLDPACRKLPYPANIDIRDTVNYKEVMKQYSLGPNGGIVTSLNLFATKFDQVLKLLEGRKGKNKYVIIDTPGQIEVFTWSASGSIITEALAASFPTIVLYVVDTPRSSNPVTFMSNMLYACSILYKTHLPFIVVMNKVDVVNCDFAIEWMRDWETFHSALTQETSFVSNLSSSMALTLDEFYKDLDTVGVSSMTGDGIMELMKAVQKATDDYHKNYLPEYEKLKKEKETATNQKQEEEIRRAENDMDEPLITSTRAYTAPTEAYITTSVDHEDETVDFEESEETKERESLKSFLETHTAKLTAKKASQSTSSGDSNT